MLLRMKLFVTIMAALLAALPAAAAEAPSTHRMVRVELANGVGTPAIEITLAEGWHTYWALPLDVGLPPQVSVEGNVVPLLFPQPERMEEEGLATLGYSDTVVLPLYDAPDGAFTAQLNYAVCADICVPVQAKLQYTDQGPFVEAAPVAVPQGHMLKPRLEDDRLIFEGKFDPEDIRILAVGRDYALLPDADGNFTLTTPRELNMARNGGFVLYDYQAGRAALYGVAPSPQAF